MCSAALSNNPGTSEGVRRARGLAFWGRCRKNRAVGCGTALERVRRNPRGRAGDIDPAPVALCMHTHAVTAQQGMPAAGVAYKWKKLEITRECIMSDKKFIG